ncbi:hypothetical protein HAX54_004508 [Datura stramonium]|uniref:Uncharacterized protein n=1 Tax=Datura stramonium TaxID=4076 RepID=A0ABS8RTR6_DATST|nr:hypothetical protein [Datura stramonium]
MAPISICVFEAHAGCVTRPKRWLGAGHNVISYRWTSSLSSNMGHNVISNNWTPGLGPTMDHNVANCHDVLLKLDPEPQLGYGVIMEALKTGYDPPDLNLVPPDVILLL